MNTIDAADTPLVCLPSERLSHTETSFIAAGDELARVLMRIRRRAITPEQYEELIEWITHERIAKGLSPNTTGNYLDAGAAFTEWVNSQQVCIDRLSGKHIENWQKELYLQHRESAQTRHVKIVALRQYYSWRELTGRGKNIAQHVPSPKRTKRVPRKFSKTELRAMFNTIDRSTPIGRRDYAVLCFFLATGARRDEAASLELHQLQLRQRVGAVRFFGKGAKERGVAFEGQAIVALQAWLADRDGLPLVDELAIFVSMSGPSKGQRLRREGLAGVVRRAIKRAKLRVEPGKCLHVLRATFATALYDQGMDLETIRSRLGHEDINTTRQYLAITDRMMSARLSHTYLDDVTGETDANTPLWVQEKRRREAESRSY